VIGGEKHNREGTMPEVKSAREATQIAQSFVKKYRTYARPLKATRQGNAWLVEIDVGLLASKIAKVKIDAKSARILQYTIPN
jgi:hypothetical protein